MSSGARQPGTKQQSVHNTAKSDHTMSYRVRQLVETVRGGTDAVTAQPLIDAATAKGFLGAAG